MLRKYLLSRYVDLKDVEEILGHSPFIYLRGVLVYSVLLFVVYVAYAISQQYPQYQDMPYVKRIAGILWLLIFCKWILWFLNLYLDCILISKDSLTVFLRDWILEYKTESNKTEIIEKNKNKNIEKNNNIQSDGEESEEEINSNGELMEINEKDKLSIKQYNIKKKNLTIFEIIKKKNSIIDFSNTNKTFLVYFTNNFWK